MTINLLVKNRAGVRHSGWNRFSGMTTVAANRSAEMWQKANQAAEWLSHTSPVQSLREQTLSHWSFINPPADKQMETMILKGRQSSEYNNNYVRKERTHMDMSTNAWPYTHPVALYLQTKQALRMRRCVCVCVIRGSLLSERPVAKQTAALDGLWASTPHSHTPSHETLIKSRI